MNVLRFSLIILLLSVLARKSFTQTIEETSTKFWKAVQEQKDEEIISSGKLLLAYINQGNYDTDSSIVYINMFTAGAYSSLGEHKKALDICLSTLEKIEHDMGKKMFTIYSASVILPSTTIC